MGTLAAAWRRVMTRGAGVSLLAVTMLVLGLVQAAFAVGPATFSQAAPAPGAVGVATRPLITVRVQDPAGISSGSLSVNGSAAQGYIDYPIGHWEDDGCDTWWVVDDTTVANVTFYMQYSAFPALPSGVSNVTATVRNAQGVTSTSSWSFSVNIAPVVNVVAPVNGATVSNLTPVISATVVDADSSSFSATMTVDGVPVVPTYNASTKTFSYTPSIPLVDATNHAVSLVVSDSWGAAVAKTWSFRTQAAPLLTTPVPANNAALGNSRPPIGLTTSDNVAGSLQMRLLLDGATVYTGAVAQGAWTWTPVSDLSMGTHTVDANVTDTDGRVSTLHWTFQVVPPASFSAAVPASGAVAASPVSPKIRVDAGARITGATFLVDGIARATTLNYPIAHQEEFYDEDYEEYYTALVIDDNTIADVTCAPVTLLPGVHTASVSVNDVSSVSTYSWSFNVNIAPTIGTVTPSASSVVGTLTPTISAQVTDDGSSFTSTMLLDGAPVVPAFNPVTKTYTYVPLVPLTDWATHTVSMTVMDSLGLSTTKVWSFQTSMAPKLTSPVPANGSTTVSTRPPIGLTTADDIAGTVQMRLSVDGSVAFTGAVPQGAWTWTPPADLTTGAHAVDAQVTDVDGNTSVLHWTFQVAPPAAFTGRVPAPGSTVGPSNVVSVRIDSDSQVTAGAFTIDGAAKPTYIDYPIGHWEDDGCDTWWVADDLTVADVYCNPTGLASGSHTAAVSVTTASSGTSTTSWSFSVDSPPTISAFAPANGSIVATLAPTITATVTDNDSAFTATMLVDGVSVTPTFNAATKTYSYKPAVPFADWTSHTVSINVTDSHGLSVAKAWSFQTRVAPKLSVPVPVSGSVMLSPRPTIGLTTADNVAGQVQMRLILDGATVFNGPVAQGAWTWTPASDLALQGHSVRAEVTDADGNMSALTWAFTSAAPLAMAQPTCTDCHTTFPAAHRMSNCAGCHGSDDCSGDGCHGEHGTEYLGPCASCHVNQHPETDASVRHLSDTAGCQACHANSLVTEHSHYPSGSAYKYQCVTCHASSDPAVKAAIAQNRTNCDACHAVSVSAPHRDLHDGAYAGTSCSGDACHLSNLSLEHAKYPVASTEKFDCATCHDSAVPAVMQAIASGTKTCSACHANADHESLHVSAHPDQTCFGSGCHSATKSLTAIHQPYAGPGTRNPQFATHCDLCHDNPAVDPSTSGTACTGACHSTEPHDNVSHTTSVACAEKCHSVSDLVSVHSYDCSQCHPGVATDGSWDGTCESAGCHTQVHAESASYNHERDWMGAEYGADCWSCHLEPTPDWNCQTCHKAILDTTAPVTSSDARSSYAGGATVNLSATDPGGNASGVKHVCYRVDGGPVIVGNAVFVAAPATGSVVHTLEYWSVDAALNADEPQAASFTIWPAETIPPVTTSDAKATYTGPATIVLSATDAGGSGVAQTHYRLDGGAEQTGTSVSVAAAGAHTIEFWSVDHNGNPESPHKTASFTVTAGVGTIRFAWNSPPAGSWARVKVTSFDGVIVYSAMSPNWSPAGWFTAVVPVSSKPYQLHAQWYDAETDEEDISRGTALIDAPGKVVTFCY